MFFIFILRKKKSPIDNFFYLKPFLSTVITMRLQTSQRKFEEMRRKNQNEEKTDKMRLFISREKSQIRGRRKIRYTLLPIFRLDHSQNQEDVERCFKLNHETVHSVKPCHFLRKMALRLMFDRPSFVPSARVCVIELLLSVIQLGTRVIRSGKQRLLYIDI